MGELFEDNRYQDPPVITDCSGPPITGDEVEAAKRQTEGGEAPGEDNIISEMWRPPITGDEVEAAKRQTEGGEAPGEDNIISEMWKSLGPFGVEKLTQQFNSIYDTGQFPHNLVKFIFIPLPKKTMATKWGNYRLISLMPHATKIFLRVILYRVKQLIDIEVDEVQFGFRLGKGTRESIFYFSIMVQKHIGVMKEMFFVSLTMLLIV